MVAARVVSVNVGRSARLGDAPRLVSSIDKRSVAGPVAVHSLGLEGDTVTDHRHHGGVHQAVYAYAQEELDHWAGELGGPLRPGFAGENLTTEGIALEECLVGEEWEVGTARFRVATVRIPCTTFRRWVAVEGYDDRGWVKRFTARRRPGVYLAVVRPGHLTAGDAVEVVHRPTHGVTADVMFRALTTERSLLPELAAVEVLPPAVARDVRRLAR